MNPVYSKDALTVTSKIDPALPKLRGLTRSPYWRSKLRTYDLGVCLPFLVKATLPPVCAVTSQSTRQ